jgi:hypothetical protein
MYLIIAYLGEPGGMFSSFFDYAMFVLPNTCRLLTGQPSQCSESGMALILSVFIGYYLNNPAVRESKSTKERYHERNPAAGGVLRLYLTVVLFQYRAY